MYYNEQLFKLCERIIGCWKENWMHASWKNRFSAFLKFTFPLVQSMFDKNEISFQMEFTFYLHALEVCLKFHGCMTRVQSVSNLSFAFHLPVLQWTVRCMAIRWTALQPTLQRNRGIVLLTSGLVPHCWIKSYRMVLMFLFFGE